MRTRPRLVTLVALLGATALAACGGGSARHPGAPQKVQVALDFTANAVHAPLYAAIRTGADRAHGIAMTIRRPGAGPDSLELVAGGRLDLGVLDIQDLAIARARGIDVVAVGELVDHPLSALIAKASIKRPRDLAGHTVGVSGLPSDPAFVSAIVRDDGGSMAHVHQVTIGFNAVTSLFTGKVDAVPVFWNAEGVALQRKHVPIREFRIEQYGAPAFPEVLLVTSAATLAKHRDRIRRTLLAIRDGVAAVRRDPAAAVKQIAAAAQTTDTGLIAAQLKAVTPIFSRDLRMHRAVLDQWAAFDARVGIVARRPDVAQAFDFSLLG